MNKPIILDNAVDRVDEVGKIFKYSYSKDMNIIKSGCEEVAFIDNDILDKNNKGAFMREILTKTEVQRERDDEEMCLTELFTKTFAERERDDEDDTNFN